MHGICTYRQYIFILFIGIGPYALEIEKFCFIINVHCRVEREGETIKAKKAVCISLMTLSLFSAKAFGQESQGN